MGPDRRNWLAEVDGRLETCQEDVRRGWSEWTHQSHRPWRDLETVKRHLRLIQPALPSSCRTELLEPFFEALSRLDGVGPADKPEEDAFQQLLQRGLSDDQWRILCGIAEALLERAQPSNTATRAFQAMVADLYDGFAIATARRESDTLRQLNVPLVKWGSGPHTITLRQATQFAFPCSVVGMPLGFASGGVLAWTALGHETVGHDILAASPGLLDQLSMEIRRRLEERFQGDDAWVVEFLTNRVEEVASDVLSILNMGPTAALGMLGYFRGASAAEGKESRLLADTDDHHTPGLWSAMIWSAAITQLDFVQKAAWSEAVERIASRDLQGQETLVIALWQNRQRVREYPPLAISRAREAADIIAEGVAHCRVGDDQPLRSIQNWTDWDEHVVDVLQPYLTSQEPVPAWMKSAIYAAHVVAAAVVVSLSGDVSGPGSQSRPWIDTIFSRMVELLTRIHHGSCEWGPLS